MKSLALLSGLLFGASVACLTAQSTLPTLPTTMTTTRSTSASSPQQGADFAGVDAAVRVEIRAGVSAAVSARLNLNQNALMPAAAIDVQGKSLGASAAGGASRLSAAIASRSSLIANKNARLRQALQKPATKGGSRGLTAPHSGTKDYDLDAASVSIPTDDLSSVVGGSSMGMAGSKSAAEGQFPDSTRGTGWPSPAAGATLLNFSVGGLNFPEPGGFMDETHLNPSLMNVTRGELRAEKRAAMRRRMQEGQLQEKPPEEGPEQTLPGLNNLGRPNLTPPLVAGPQFSDVHSVYPTSDLRTGYPK